MKLFSIKKNSSNYSLPSLALTIFYSTYNQFKIKKTLGTTIDKYVRRAYYGGRCEVFGNSYNNESVFHYDFKGMYAQCMMEDFPSSNPEFNYENFNLEIPGFYDID